MQWLLALLVLLIMLTAGGVSAHDITLNASFKTQKITTVYYSFAPTSLASAQQLEVKNWHRLTNRALNLGLEQRPVWIQFTIHNPLNREAEPVLSLDNPLLDEVHIYQLLHSQPATSQTNPQAAQAAPLTTNDPFLVKLSLPANSTSTIIINVKNSVGLYVPLTLWQQSELLAYKSKLNLFYGLLIGLVCSLAVSCLILYAFTAKHYFAYAGAITLMLSVLLYYICGFGLRFFELNLPLQQQSMIPMLFIFITLLFYLLQRCVCQPKASLWLTVQTISTLIYATSAAFIWLFPALVVSVFCLLATPLILTTYIATTLLCIRYNPSKSNKALLLALGFFLAVIGYFIFTIFGYQTLTSGSLVLVFLCFFSCSLCLLYSVTKLFILQRDEQVTAQQALLAKNAAQDALLNERLANQQAVSNELEAQVDERTFELQVALRELEEKNRQLEQLNMEDPLTGIKNRRFLDKKLVMELRRSRREQTPLSIIMLDIDNFKVINDSYGHLTGDQVIRTVSDIIKQQLQRPLDEVTRYGGEEFVVLLPNTKNAGALEIAEKIRQTIAQSNVSVAGTSISFTVSAGVYTSVANDINNPEIFTERADKALYFAKQHGRNQVVNFPIPQ
jgi:diguanylate cyclase (GGDEF)-like protein